MNSRYIVFPKAGQVKVDTEIVPPPGPGEVLCAAEKSLISIGTELFCLRGEFDPGTNWSRWVTYPFRPGYSMVARILAVGKEVTGLTAGDLISCWAPHQEYLTIPADTVMRVPDGLSPEDATLASLAVTAQLGVRRAQHDLGDTVGVVGLGMLGQLVVQYVALSGARKIVAIDTASGRVAAATRHGATHALDMSVEEAHPVIEDITEGRMLDVVYDVTGHPPVLAASIPLLRKLGRLVLLGDSPAPSQQFLGPGVVSESIAILGIHGSLTPETSTEFNPWTRSEATALFFDYILQGRMKVSDLITHRDSLTNAPTVYQNLRTNRSNEIGVVFNWPGQSLVGTP